MNFDVHDLSSELLEALSSSDLPEVEANCSSVVTVFGTDEEEEWFSRGALIQALSKMKDVGLHARWNRELVSGRNWTAGTALYDLPDGSQLPVRVTMVFEHGLLVHAHFSVGRTVKLMPAH